MVQAGMPEIVDFSMQQQPLEITAWTPGSPRLSFSRDFVQSDVFNPSTRDSAGGATSDFDFGMLALLKMDDPVSTTADELFHNGRLLPVDVASTSTEKSSRPKAEDPSVHQLLLEEEASDTIGALEQSASRSAPPQNPQQQIPKSPSSRWKELFGLKRSSRGSFSETEPLNILNGSSPSSSSSARFSSASKLKLLFRSSSAGAGRGDRTAVEPCLGRSASESKVSSCCNSLQVVENNAAVAAGGAQLLEGMTEESRPLSSSSSSSSQKSQHHRRRRKALVEVKGSPARINSRASSSAPRSPNYQRLNQNSRPRLRQQQQQQQQQKAQKKNKDAWRVYNERINASNGSAAASGSVKVAEVLHMEVCMGQSMVVSKVAKARIFDFMKKENKSSDAHEKASAAKGA